jgi:hypothetical protein
VSFRHCNSCQSRRYIGAKYGMDSAIVISRDQGLVSWNFTEDTNLGALG